MLAGFVFFGGAPVEFGTEGGFFHGYMIPKPEITIGLGSNLKDIVISSSSGMKIYEVDTGYKLISDDADEVRIRSGGEKMTEKLPQHPQCVLFSLLVFADILDDRDIARRGPARMLNPRTLLAIVHDCGVSIVAWLLAYNLRFNFVVPAQCQAYAWQSLAWVVPLQMLLFWRFCLYRGIWRFASLTDLRRIVFAVGLSTLLIGLMLVMLQPPFVVPRSVLILDPILLMFMMGGSRLAYSVWKEHRMSLGLLSDRNIALILLFDRTR